MPSVLVVDDTSDFCAQVAAGLAEDGHDVRTATNPRDAIGIGCVFQPDVLITDWLLQDHIDGLSTSEVIRLASPRTKTILITGFASEDLRNESNEFDVFEFIEKPFHLRQIREAVLRAARHSRSHPPRHRIATLVVNSAGEIITTNDYTHEILRKAGLSALPAQAFDIVSRDDLARISGESERNWVEVSPLVAPEFTWHVRSRSLNRDKSIWVLVEDSQIICRQSALVYRLLGFREPSLNLRGHILVVDDDHSVRQTTARVLRELNCLCHTAQSHEEAVRLVVRDVDIRFAIVDYEMPEGDPGELVKMLSRLRQDIRIIGTSGAAYSREFAAIGVKHFLPKPWNLELLIDALTLEE